MVWGVNALTCGTADFETSFSIRSATGTRALSGLVAAVVGRHGDFVAAAIANLAKALALYLKLSGLPKRERVPYPELIGSVFTDITRSGSAAHHDDERAGLRCGVEPVLERGDLPAVDRAVRHDALPDRAGERGRRDGRRVPDLGGALPGRRARRPAAGAFLALYTALMGLALPARVHVASIVVVAAG